MRNLLSLALTLAILLGAAALALVAPQSPVPDRWNPFRPLDPAAAPTPVTRWKLGRADRSPAYCRTALAGAPGLAPADDREESGACHIRTATAVSRLSAAALAPVETRCVIALRLLMWERHSLQPAARELLGAGVARIEHLQSYSCRPMRTPGGGSERMSEHATANAIDIAGFVLADGRRVSVRDWGGDGPEAAFLRRARDGACRWFRAVLGPDHNALHADHLHLDLGRWPVCR